MFSAIPSSATSYSAPPSSTYLNFTKAIALFIVIIILFTHPHTGFADVPPPVEEMSPIEIVDYLVTNESVYWTLYSSSSSEEALAAIFEMMAASGQEGFEYLLQVAEQASREDLIRQTTLLSMYRYAGDINVKPLLDFIDRKGKAASTYDDVAIVYPLIANLGFFPDHDGSVEAFLMGLASDPEAFTEEWPVMGVPTDDGQFSAFRKAGLLQELRSIAIMALFYTNTESALVFLEAMRDNAPSDSYLRRTLDFYFDILERFDSLEDYSRYMSEGVIESPPPHPPTSSAAQWKYY